MICDGKDVIIVLALFDTYSYVKKLRDAGLAENQAEIHAVALQDLIESNLATKEDWLVLKEDLKQNIRGVEASLKQDINKVEASLREDIKKIESSLKQDILTLQANTNQKFEQVKTAFSRVDTKISTSQHTIIKWLIGLFISQLGLTITLIKLL
ncbi:hypothetical protein GMMP15_1370066 [Candidatus Magnetomoraceae bacterium gMMP-15]